MEFPAVLGAFLNFRDVGGGGRIALSSLRKPRSHTSQIADTLLFATQPLDRIGLLFHFSVPLNRGLPKVRCTNAQPFLCNELGPFQALFGNFQAIFRQFVWALFR